MEKNEIDDVPRHNRVWLFAKTLTAMDSNDLPTWIKTKFK